MKKMFPSMNGGKAEKKTRPPLTEAAALEGLHQRYPYEATRLLNKLQSFMREYAPKDLKDYLNRTGMGNSLEVAERVRVVMLDHEREMAEREADNPAAKAMFSGSPGMMKARENSVRVSLADRLRSAVHAGKCDFIEAYGPVDNIELELARRTESPANGDGEGGEE